MTTARELDRRTSDRIEVALMWDARDDRVWIELVDGRTGELVRFDVEAADALDAFHHPYAYEAARRRARRAVAA